MEVSVRNLSFIPILLAFILLNPLLRAHANVLGDMQTFAPNSDGLDFVTVHTSRPLTQGYFALGGHFTYAKDHLVVFSDLNTQKRYDYHHELVEFDVDFAYGLTDKISAFFAAPTLLYQHSEAGQAQHVGISKGVHTYRPGLKWTLGGGPYEFAVVASIDIINADNSPYTGVTKSNIYNLEFAKTFFSRGKVAYGVNVGYRWRTPSAMPADAAMFPLDDQVTFSVGRSGPLFATSRWVLEGIFSLPVDKAPYKNTVDASSIDILLGFKHRLMRNLNFDWGGTIEPGIDTQSPRYRAFIGLVYYFNPGWTSNQDRANPPPPVPPAANLTAEAAADEAAATASSALFLAPENSTVWEGMLVRYQVRGGEPPYRFTLIAGSGRLNTHELYYHAPLQPENAVIQVTDSAGKTKTAYVTVKTPPRPSETIRMKNLNFIFDTDILVESSKKEINRIVNIFRRKQVRQIIVEGHTDNKGSNEYNEILSEKRAQTVRRYLIQGLGLTEEQVSAIGFGEARPIDTNATAKGRLQNRRVDLKVYYN